MKADDVTQLLHRWKDGDQEAFDGLLTVLYDRLKRLAHARLRGERAGHTLNTTGLVHEAYLRLIDIDQVRWEDRGHFLAVASRVMRRVLIDHAREQKAAKRGGHVPNTEFRDDLWMPEEHAQNLLELDDALQQLERAYPRKGRAVDLRYFGGLTLEETADALGVSPPTVMRDVRFAEAWLARAWDAAP